MTENALANFHGTSALANPDAFDAAVTKAQTIAPTVNSGNSFLKLGKDDGIWYYGSENVEVEEASRWAINVYDMQHGLVCWSDAKVTKKKAEILGEIMVPFNVDAPPAHEQTDHSEKGGEWKDQVGFDLVCVSGEDKGTTVSYSASSIGGCKAYNEVLKAIQGRPSVVHVFPIITMGETHYANKFGGTTYNPELYVVDWADAENNLLGGNEAVAQVEDKTEEPAEEAAPPKRRRRRGS